MSKRLPFTTFTLSVPELRRGYYTAVYFWREKRILEKEKIDKYVLMQVFNKVEGASVCGIDEALAILKLGTGYWKDYNKMYPLFDNYIRFKQELRAASDRNDFTDIQRLTSLICNIRHELNNLWVDTHNDLNIRALHDGDISSAFEAVMTIEGMASEFAHLESIFLGVLARSTKVATNTRLVVEAAANKPILFFCDRFDRWTNQVADGYAAMKSGVYGVATDAMGEWWGVSGLGTIPHALIALFDGNTTNAALAFSKHYPDVSTIALVDFDNDCVNTSLNVARSFADNGKELWGVRLDTSESMVDKSVIELMGQFKPTGVCAPLVENVRNALDNGGFNNVKIVVSGGFNPQRIREFENAKIPVDVYGVGSWLLSGNYDYTADIVIVDKKPMAKKGRAYRPSQNLKSFNWSDIEENKS
ncbi:MAG: quinolinate phosphoribosyl transferase [Spirochaetota bacterium]|nr:quinolinate phosphoribosyl transferase [Spirochaetota bacterium]